MLFTVDVTRDNYSMQINSFSGRQMCVFFDMHIMPISIYRDINLCLKLIEPCLNTPSTVTTSLLHHTSMYT